MRFTHRLATRLWVLLSLLFVAISLFPVSNRITRTAGLVLFVISWIGLIGLCWRQRVARFVALGFTALAAVFLALPARALPSADVLQADYVRGLQRYEGVTYLWGGESPKGIDCSGLIRRGLIDALFCRGVRSFDGGLVRRSLVLWWQDTTAATLGTAGNGLTVPLLDTPSINALDHTPLLPGDLAVTQDGVHIMAYLGGRRWIEADPGVGRVIAVTVPAAENMWFHSRMHLVRWSLLQP